MKYGNMVLLKTHTVDGGNYLETVSHLILHSKIEESNAHVSSQASMSCFSFLLVDKKDEIRCRIDLQALI